MAGREYAGKTFRRESKGYFIGIRSKRNWPIIVLLILLVCTFGCYVRVSNENLKMQALHEFEVSMLRSRIEKMQSETIAKQSEINLLQSTLTESVKVQEEKALPFEIKDLGTFKLTHYCDCEICNGHWGKNRPIVDGKKVVLTASGAFAQQNVTVAVDKNVIPLGTKLYIEGYGVRIAQDNGGAIKGNKVDIFVKDHKTAKSLGVKNARVWIIK